MSDNLDTISPAGESVRGAELDPSARTAREARDAPPASPLARGALLAQLPWLLALAALLLVPLIFSRDLSEHYDFAKSFTFRFLLLAAFFTWCAACGGFPRLRNPLSLPFLVLILGESLSLFAAVNMAEGLDSLALPDLVGYYFLIGLVFAWTQSRRRLVQGLTVVVASALLVAVVAIVQLLGFNPWGLSPENLPLSTIGNHNFATYIQDAVFPLAAALFVSNLLHAWRGGGGVPAQAARIGAALLLLVYLVAAGWQMAYSQSFGNHLSMVVAAWVVVTVLVATRLFPAREGRDAGLLAGKAFAACAVSVVLLVMAAGAFTQTSLFRTQWEKDSNVFRREVWANSLQKVQDNVWLGIGPGNFHIVHPLYATETERRAIDRERLARRAHNDFLEKIVEGGVVSAVGVFWLVGVTALVLLRNLSLASRLSAPAAAGRAPPAARADAFDYWLALGHIGSVVAIGVHALVEAPLRQSGSAVLFCFVLGTLAAQHARLRRLEAFATAAAGPRPPAVPTGLTAVRLPLPPALLWGLALVLFTLLFLPGYRTWLAQMHTRQITVARDNVVYWRARNEMDQVNAMVYQTMAHIDRVRELNLPDRLVWYEVGSFLTQTGEFGPAVEAFWRDLQLNPNYQWSHNNAGFGLEQIAEQQGNTPGRLRDARAHYYAALIIDPYQSKPYLNLGVNFMRLQEFHLARGYLTIAILHDPALADAYKYRAVANQHLADQATETREQQRLREQIVNDLSQFFAVREQLAPDEVEVLYHFAGMLEEVSRLDEAIAAWSRYEKETGFNLKIRLRLVDLLARTGRVDRAEEMLRVLLRRRPDDAELHYSLARVLAYQGQPHYRESMEVLARALRADPELAERAQNDAWLNPLREYAEFRRLIYR